MGLLQYKLFFDGGANPNPGRAYCSFEIKDNKDNVVWLESEMYLGYPKTNNEAEYLGLLRGIQKLIEINNNSKIPLNTKTINLNIWSDSQLVVQTVSGRWKCKKKNLKVLLDEIKNELKCFGGFVIKWYGRDNNVSKFGH